MESEYDHNFRITGAMMTYGGSFVAELGALWRLGDSDNQRRLEAAFPEYWKKYNELSRPRKEKP